VYKRIYKMFVDKYQCEFEVMMVLKIMYHPCAWNYSWKQFMF